MRRVRVSRTALLSFQKMLTDGADKFGVDICQRKASQGRKLHPLVSSPSSAHGLRTIGKSFRHYPVEATPFTIVYEFDNEELRVLFILHNRADRRALNRSSVEW